MILTHLTAVGPGLPEATIEFGPGLTIIYGASDTGKSYIAQAIDFVMGSSSLRSIREAADYTHLLLGISFTDERHVTLVRPISGTARNDKIAVYSGMHMELPVGQADILLAPKHNSRSSQNMSRYLLSQIGLDGRVIRRNALNQSRILSFRDVARLCNIDETDMVSQTSPTLSGQYIKETAEKSVFKFFVDGRDDSNLAGSDQSPDQRKVSKGKAELLDKLIAELRESVTSDSEVAELRRQHARVLSSIEELTESVTTAVAERDRLLASREDVRNQIRANRGRLGEISELLARFTLLRQQYESDIDRLDMIREVGDLLGYFDRGVCVFCGAAVGDQRPPSGHVIAEMTEIADVVNAERDKTISLRDDLAVTLADIARQGTEVQAALENWQEAQVHLDLTLKGVQEDLAPKDQVLGELLSKRSDVERQMGAHEQIERLELLRGDLSVEDEPVEPGGTDVSAHQLSSLGRRIAALLTAWNVPHSAIVDFDMTNYDLVVDGQARSSRGKGIRAVSHAAYTVGLALHRRAANEPYPGFVVLDSPLITYRGPEREEAGQLEGEFVSQTVADAFFRYLASHSVGQVIVLENTDPPTDVKQAVVTYFTGSAQTGRCGYFPPRPVVNQLW